MKWLLFKAFVTLDRLKRACLCRRTNISIGRGTYGTPQVFCHGNASKLEIGSYCSISARVRIFLQADHRHDWVSTFPFSIIHRRFADITGHPASKGDIRIGSDVWLGYGAAIMSGVTIGSGAVVGAFAVVSKDVPDYAIVVGNPARIVGYRFDEQTIMELLRVKWWELREEEVLGLVPLLLSPDTKELIARVDELRS